MARDKSVRLAGARLGLVHQLLDNVPALLASLRLCRIVESDHLLNRLRLGVPDQAVVAFVRATWACMMSIVGQKSLSRLMHLLVLLSLLFRTPRKLPSMWFCKTHGASFVRTGWSCRLQADMSAG